MTLPTVDVIHGTNSKPVATEALVADIQDEGLRGQLLVGYPVMASPEGRYAIDALYISPDLGLVCFDLIEGLELGDFARRQDDAYRRLYSKLLPHQQLVRRRELLTNISTLTYAPAITNPPHDDEHPVLNGSTLASHLTNLPRWEANAELYLTTVSAIQSITSIRRLGGSRQAVIPESRAGRLHDLENSIATLDQHQRRAVIETVNGVQRIRGLAGSGKTIVLALKAAYLHAQHPDWRIAVTFNTRSLKEFFKRLITIFSIAQTGEEPDWNMIRVLNSWGAPGGPDRDGIYHEFCAAHDLDYLDYNSARREFTFDEAFEGAVSNALSLAGERRQLYDAILVDEAQDFAPVFLKLCHSILREPKRLVYAYDELQNLTNLGLPSAQEIFGVDHNGSPLVTFDDDYPRQGQRDIILEKCYRNSRPILVSAHALGFGIYRRLPSANRPGLVQMFDRPELWEDVGYRVKSGQLALGESVRLTRTPDTSPRFLEDHSPAEDLVSFNQFEDEHSQAEWVAAQIEANLDKDELQHSDIVVINTNPLTTRKKLGLVRRALLDKSIRTHLAGVDTDPDVFRQPGSVTCTGINRVKGNEFAMVYVVNTQECHASGPNLSRIRNRLFTAMTRSTAWLRVTGIGPHMTSLIEEFNCVKEAAFELSFRYPTSAELKELTIVHRDMSETERRGLEKHRRSITELLEDAQQGRLFVEDLDEDDLAALRELIS